MRKKIKKIVTIIMTIVILFSAFILTGCNLKADKYTEQQNIQRVTKRIQAKYIDGDEKLRPYDKPVGDGKIYDKVKATSFAVFPLYDENDALKYFLVEFEPFGFLFVFIRDDWFSAFTSMYMLSSVAGEALWSRYKIDETNSQQEPDTDKLWEVDDNEERIFYYNSPYKIANVENEKRYLLHLSDENFSTCYIPAIKIENDYLNLISMEELKIAYGDEFVKKQATMYTHFINKKYFYL